MDDDRSEDTIIEFVNSTAIVEDKTISQSSMRKDWTTTAKAKFWVL